MKERHRCPARRHRDAESQVAVDELVRLLKKYPDLRICQLIGNAVPPPLDHEGNPRGSDFYYLEDYKLRTHLMEFDAKVIHQQERMR